MGVIGSSPTNPTNRKGPFRKEGPFLLADIVRFGSVPPHDRGGEGASGAFVNRPNGTKCRATIGSSPANPTKKKQVHEGPVFLWFQNGRPGSMTGENERSISPVSCPRVGSGTLPEFSFICLKDCILIIQKKVRFSFPAHHASVTECFLIFE